MPSINESDLFPIASADGCVVLEICNCSCRDSDYDANDLVLHFVLWEMPDANGNRRIRDVKEERINVPESAREDWDFLFALKRVIADVLTTYHSVECLMPEDLFRPAWSALSLKNRDFDASLRMKSRLGKFLAR